MSILAMLVMGVLAGAIASMLMGGTGLGIIGDLLVGLVGSFIGGYFFGSHLSVTSSEFANVLITATVGAIIFLFVIGLFARPYSRRSRIA
ncbi:MAG: GlsB/YeaQ/YmgE family stress response membrane protein [bacterium]|nr:GlsB/YeaQ/YmgE family stress response membrane protein [bacterium]